MSTALADFHSRLWHQFRDLAKQRTGQQVVDALKAASEKVYAAGIDKAYAGLPLDETLALGFDMTWLTAAMIELRMMRKP